MAGASGGGEGVRGDADAIAFEPLPVIASERRLHVRAYHYWRARADGRAMPTLGDCADIASTGFAKQMILIDVASGDRRARIRTIGRDLARELPTSDGAGSGLVEELLVRLPTVALQRSPIGFEAETPGHDEGGRCFRGILLPIADESGAIAHVMGVMSWRHLVAANVDADIAAAVVGLPLAAASGATSSPWSLPAMDDQRPLSAPASDRFAVARTWLALAETDRARSQAHLHASIGVAHDAVADCPQADRAAMLASIFDGQDIALIARVLDQARLLAIGGADLARRLDAADGIAGFLSVMEAAAEPASGAFRLRFRLSPLAPDLLTPVSRREDGEPETSARRASR
jgi:hypothetical protein